MHIRPGFLFFVTALLVVAGCSRDSTEADGTQQLLAAEGSWQMVEEQGPPDPLADHMQARAQVDPSKVDGSASYTSKPKAEEVGENVHFRLLRLESQMENLRGDFKKILPPLSNMIASDEELDRTIDEIEARDDAAMAASAPPATLVPAAPAAGPAVMPKPTPVKAAPPAPSSSPAAVTGLRLGEHPGKTRIVLDLSAPSSFKYDLDNTERLLLIELPAAGWSAAMQKSFKNHPLVKSYTAQAGANGGTTVAVELQKEAKVVTSSALTPNEVYGHRVMIDISSL